MIRVMIEAVLLFLLPAVLYVAFVMLRDGASRPTRIVLNEAPLGWLALAGAIMVTIVLVLFQTPSGGQPGQSYQPAVVRDGVLQPGHFK